MSVVVTGADGYLGWPTALKLSERIDERIILVDNFARREWVDKVGGVSAADIATLGGRVRGAEGSNMAIIRGDLTDSDFVDELIRTHEPETIVHLAAQPSAPYSQINRERANYTQRNNNESTRNLLWTLKEQGLMDTHFIETTTMGIYGAPDFTVPEGSVEAYNNDESGEIPYPANAGSWYHMSKAFDVANLRLANKQFDLPVSDVRTGIIYGTQTEEIPERGILSTRLDFDYYFGTVVHRFIAQTIAGYPVTVYGEGKQRKPFISLEDAAEGIVRLVELGEQDHTVYNQTTETLSIVNIADAISMIAKDNGFNGEIEHFENPRDEDETHKMEVENENYMGLLNGDTQRFESGIFQVFESIQHNQQKIEAHEDRFLPGVLGDE
jgi:nucleoside-diphosphate-sugar epimerase